MEKNPKGGGPIVFLAACGMVLCCALPVLLASGGLGAVTAWFLDGSVVWLALAGALAVAAGGLFLKLRSAANKQDGLARASVHVEDLYEAADLASVRRRIEALPGVREAGAHRRSDGARAAAVWAVYDPRDLPEEAIAAAVRGMGFTVADTAEDVPSAAPAGS